MLRKKAKSKLAPYTFLLLIQRKKHFSSKYYPFSRVVQLCGIYLQAPYIKCNARLTHSQVLSYCIYHIRSTKSNIRKSTVDSPKKSFEFPQKVSPLLLFKRANICTQLLKPLFYILQLLYLMLKLKRQVYLETKKRGKSIILDLPQFVIPLGLEPRAHTLKVYCSTN